MRIEYVGVDGRGEHPVERELAARTRELSLNLVSFSDGRWNNGRYVAVLEHRKYQADGGDELLCVIHLHADDPAELFDWLARYERGEAWD